MKKGNVIALFVLGLFMISFLAGVVSAETVFDNIRNGLTNLSFGGVEFGTGFAQLLMFFLVTLIVFSIAEFLPFVGDSDWIAFAISAIIGFLSIFYLNPTEVYTILLSYGALGIALTSVIPFILIAVLAKKLFEKGHIMFSRIIWIVFAVALGFKWLLADMSQIGIFGRWAYPVVLIATIAMILFQKWVYFKMFKDVMKGEVTTANSKYVTHLTAKIEKIEEQLSDAGPETTKKLEEERDELIKKLNKATSR